MNSSRRLFLKALTTLSAIPLLSTYSPNVEALVIASHVWSGYQLMFLARDEGWLLPQNISLLETLSATDSFLALVSGKADGAALTLDEVLRARALGIKLTCVLVFDVSAGADMVLSKQSLTRLENLRGKRIGFEKSGLGSLMLYRLLQAAKLESSAIIPVAINYDRHFAAWHQDIFDVLITFEPVASQLLNQGAHKIFDSREVPDTIFDVLAIKSELLNSQSEHLKSLVFAHFQARQYFYHNTQDACYKMATRMQLSAEDVLNSFRGLILPNEQTNEKYLTERHSTVLNMAKITSELMLELGIIKQPDDLQHLLYAGFLPSRS